MSSNGTIYATELFGGKITAFRDGRRHTFATVGLPAAVEVHGRYLYATVDALPAPDSPPDGKVVRYRL